MTIEEYLKWDNKYNMFKTSLSFPHADGPYDPNLSMKGREANRRWRRTTRAEFRKFMRNMGWTFTELHNTSTSRVGVKESIRFAAIMEQFFKKIREREKRLVKNHQRRLAISRVAMRTGLPGDLGSMDYVHLQFRDRNSILT